MKQRLIIIAWLIAAAAPGADLNLTWISRTNEVPVTVKSRRPISFSQADNVRLDIYVRRAGNVVTLDQASAYAVWEAASVDQGDVLYLVATGSVASASSGLVRFELSRDQANLPEDRYESIIRYYYPEAGTNIAATIDRADLDVQWSPDADNVAYAGPFTNGYILDPAKVTVQSPTAWPWPTDDEVAAQIATSAPAASTIAWTNITDRPTGLDDGDDTNDLISTAADVQAAETDTIALGAVDALAGSVSNTFLTIANPTATGRGTITNSSEYASWYIRSLTAGAYLELDGRTNADAYVSSYRGGTNLWGAGLFGDASLQGNPNLDAWIIRDNQSPYPVRFRISREGVISGNAGGMTNLNGGAITGTVADARIASTIARDPEVAGLVYANTNWPNSQPVTWTGSYGTNAVLSYTNGGLQVVDLTGGSVTNISIATPPDTALVWTVEAYLTWDGAGTTTINTNAVTWPVAVGTVESGAVTILNFRWIPPAGTTYGWEVSGD